MVMKKGGHRNPVGRPAARTVLRGEPLPSAKKASWSWTDVKPERTAETSLPERKDDIVTIRPARIERLAPFEMPDDAVESMQQAAEENRGKPTVVRTLSLGGRVRGEAERVLSLIHI